MPKTVYEHNNSSVHQSQTCEPTSKSRDPQSVNSIECINQCENNIIPHQPASLSRAIRENHQLKNVHIKSGDPVSKSRDTSDKKQVNHNISQVPSGSESMSMDLYWGEIIQSNQCISANNHSQNVPMDKSMCDPQVKYT